MVLVVGIVFSESIHSYPKQELRTCGNPVEQDYYQACNSELYQPATCCLTVSSIKQRLGLTVGVYFICQDLFVHWLAECCVGSSAPVDKESLQLPSSDA
eukprot:4201607-Amphidinium_carterae.1